MSKRKRNCGYPIAFMTMAVELMGEYVRPNQVSAVMLIIARVVAPTLVSALKKTPNSRLYRQWRFAMVAFVRVQLGCILNKATSLCMGKVALKSYNGFALPHNIETENGQFGCSTFFI